MKTLVVYFSRSHHTEQIAKEIAKRCGADLEEVREERSRTGLLGYWRSAWEVLRHADAPIQPPIQDPADYDLVIIGTPVWVQQPAPPVRTYARQYARRFKQVAFFCTEGSNGERRAFEELGRLCGQQPLATLVVTEKQLPVERHTEQLQQFAAHLPA